jgi:hypothetical protein
VIFGFAAYTKSPSLEAREENTHEFTERGRVQYRDSLCSASRDVVRIDTPPRYGAFAFVADLVYPTLCQRLLTVTGEGCLPEHSKHLPLSLGLRPSFVAMELRSNFR